MWPVVFRSRALGSVLKDPCRGRIHPFVILRVATLVTTRVKRPEGSQPSRLAVHFCKAPHTHFRPRPRAAVQSAWAESLPFLPLVAQTGQQPAGFWSVLVSP